MQKPNYVYPFAHWLATMLVAPFLLLSYSALTTDTSGSDGSQVAFLGYILLFSIGFSLPVLLVYVLLFILLVKTKMHWLAVKGLLNIAAIAGVLITFNYLGGNELNYMAWWYGAAIILCSLLLRVYLEDEPLAPREPLPAENE